MLPPEPVGCPVMLPNEDPVPVFDGLVEPSVNRVELDMGKGAD